MRTSLIGTAYNMGISHIAAGFAEHMDMKALLVHNKPFALFPERFKEHRITETFTDDDVEWLLKDTDVLFTIETPYRWDIYQKAKKRGIRTYLMPMLEWLPRSRPELNYVDTFICPSAVTYQALDVASERKVQMPCEVPIDLSKFKPRQITQAKTFVHIAGHGGVRGRNSTREVMDAMQFVKEDIKLIIRSQMPLTDKPADSRIIYLEGNVKDYFDMYDEGDVWLMPHKYGVAFLGLGESMAAGMIPMMTDMPPFSWFLPQELLIAPASVSQKTLISGQTETWAEQNPQFIANCIDYVARMPEPEIRSYADWAKNKAQEWSWDTLKDKYQLIFSA